ncbi:MAG: methanogenesis marker 16 metalloprotein [Candidatus Nezhaarchaeota archaeon]|nr:methanogenesis marker 16 metalloprotein [Candidatus Nezhaarchaeota archaeon]MCX8142384.1 methanogenesis marker 16 metalloprotein [Candidatus Nezhaarchaeota archaeon]MDW8050643.1 methanogenesis marker 16 metalloprotein [Nitrososphaerota archaeon]
MTKTIDEINRKIERGEAVILTAEELCDMVRRGEHVDVDDVDVVTAATCGIMSGTMAIFSFRVSECGTFTKAAHVWMNGVPAYPGPCPNERLGILDVVVYSTSRSIEEPESYGGAALFCDLVEGKKAHVKVESVEGKLIESDIKLDEMGYAKMLTTRSAFKNYMAFVNPDEKPVKTIFSVGELKGPWRMATVSGCGELNPLEKDPLLRTVGVGSRVLINDVIGYVIGTGTRSTKDRPNLSICANMKGMNTEFMGQFITSAGPELYISIAIPIPILDHEMLQYAKRLDSEIPLPVANVNNRMVIGYSNYAYVWQKADLEVKYDSNLCKNCGVALCPVEEKCPTKAFIRKEHKVLRSKCFDCGACTWLCLTGAFRANLGNIIVDGRVVPIVLRQSSRRKARELASRLKMLVEEGAFLLKEPVDELMI